MDAVGALQTTRSALLMLDAIKIQVATVSEFLKGSHILVENLGETNPRAQAVMRADGESEKLEQAMATFRKELQFRAVQLLFANGAYGENEEQ